jgi:hypothetical protein
MFVLNIQSLFICTMSNSSFSSLIQPLLCDFAASGEFTTQMIEIFGFSTNSTKIGTLQQQWQQQDFSQLPQIEVVGTEVLNGAKDGYSIQI